MGLLADIQAEAAPRPTACSVAKVLEQLEPAEAKELEAALADDAITHTAITRVLNRRGFGMHDKRVAAHRRGACACPK